MTTFTWKSGTSADWGLAQDWTPSTGAPPGHASTGIDVANLNNTRTGPKSSYQVSIAAGEGFNLAAVNLRTGSGAHALPSLSIAGDLTTGTLGYAGTDAAVTTIAAGGVLTIRTGITDTRNTAQTIAIAADNGGAAGSGGHLALGSTTVDNANVSFSFSNRAATALNTGVIAFGTAAANTSQHINNLAWGDRITFAGADFTGDTAAFDAATHVLTVKSGGATVLTMNNVTLQSGAADSFAVAGDAITAVCYAAGTQILTPAGERAIETLQPGDVVLTEAEGGLLPRPVQWIGRRRLDLLAHPQPGRVAPIRIQRDAFADAVPHADLLVSPDHAVVVDGSLVCARQLVNGTTIRQETALDSVTYLHVELDGHAILLAEGLAAESYLDTGNHDFFADAADKPATDAGLQGQQRRQAASCLPFVWDGAAVQPLWQRLTDRAAALGHPRMTPEVTADPALHLVADGRVVLPLRAADGRYVFALSRSPTDLHLVSRHGVPVEVQPWLDDRRCLGVCVERILLRGPDGMREVPVDHPALRKGWWPAERDGLALRRWTNGRAVLRLSAAAGPVVLEVQIQAGGMQYGITADAVSQAA